jgi:hypothetical protein
VKGEKIRPQEIEIGKTRLLHSQPPSIKIRSGTSLSTLKPIRAKGKEDCARLTLRAQALGYHVSIVPNIKDLEIFDLHFDTNTHTTQEDYVVKRVSLLYDPEIDEKDIWVYDLETENHHFHVGPGNMIVHNTDSVMASLGIEDPLEAVKEGERLEKELTSLFPPPMNMELEKVMRILCLRKKRYVAALVDPKTGTLGLTRDKLLIKGIQLV